MKMGEISQIGNNIRYFRTQKGLTQRDLADSVLVSFQAISAWERGLSIPDLENVVRLASFFDITVDALLTGTARELYIGIDGSGTKTEFVLFEKDGTVRNVIRLTGSNPNDRGLDACLDVLCTGMEKLLTGRTPQAVFAGIAGASNQELRTAIASQLRDRFRTNATVDSDAANVLSCSNNPNNAIAIICGTGSCVFVKKNNNRYRLGGWGHLLDQAGSAYDVGKDGIRCALAAQDGMQPQTLMTQRISRELGGDPYMGIPSIYKKGRSYIASFAKIVVDAALEGDACALQVLQENARRLADIILTAVRRFGKPDEFVASGELLQCQLFRNIVEQMADIHLTMPDIPPVYGACIEALKMDNASVSPNFHSIFMESYQRLSR